MNRPILFIESFQCNNSLQPPYFTNQCTLNFNEKMAQADLQAKLTTLTCFCLEIRMSAKFLKSILDEELEICRI